MSRRARLAIAGIPWHIIQRGHNHSACFFTECDYMIYLKVLGEQAAKFGCAVHSYVLMTNHVHLLLTPTESDSASLMMKNLGQRYVQYVNRSYDRSGTLWEGRFKSCLVQSSRYLFTCQRYIELNPVRAKMVAYPADYRWSSFRTNAYGKSISLITPHVEYLNLSSNILERRKAYRDLFGGPLNNDKLAAIRNATNGNFVLGNRKFAREIEKVLGTRVTPGRPGRPRKQGADHSMKSGDRPQYCLIAPRRRSEQKLRSVP